MSIVGVIANPVAGKDIRRLVAAATPVSDATKVGIIRRAVLGAIDGGAERILLAPDPHHLCRRAVAELDLPVEVLDEPVTGRREDTIAAAAAMWKRGVGAVIALGGDGTQRDIAVGWPEVPLLPLSTGTNNVFPLTVTATAAGVAAGLVAAGSIDREIALRRAKRLVLDLPDATDGPPEDVALVDVALIDEVFVGSRAVWDARRVVTVIAAIGPPSATGLSAIAGRVHPVDRWEPTGVAVHLDPHRSGTARAVRVPVVPGQFATVRVRGVRPLALGDSLELAGPGVIALDGERHRVLVRGASAVVTLDAGGPDVIAVEAVLQLAADLHLFDTEDDDGD